MDQQTSEKWRAVVGFEGLYEVSVAGHVRRVGRAARNGKGRGGGAHVGRVLKQQTRRNSYLSVQLWSEGKYASRLVHCLVAAAFIGPKPPGMDVNHRDGDKSRNAIENLEYLTRSQNNQHAYDTGLKRTGERHGRAKLTAAQVDEIRVAHSLGKSCTALGKEFGVSRGAVRLIIQGKNWRHHHA